MASVTKTRTKAGDIRYRVRWRDLSGDQREKWYRRKVDADRFARNIETDKDRQVYRHPDAGREPFRNVADTWMRTRADRARSTRDRDRSYLNSLILPTFGNRPVRAIRPSDVRVWVTNLGVAPTTRGKALQIVRAILEMGVQDGLISANPAATVKAPKQVPQRVGKALTDEQVEQVITAADEIDPRTSAMVYLMTRCGLRIGEAIALRRRDVDLDRGLLTVANSMSRRAGLKPVKGRVREDQARTLPMPQDVVVRLRRHLAQRQVSNMDGYVFTTASGKSIRYTNWRSRVWTKIVELVGFDVVPHDLRHTVATRLFTVDRWNPPEVQAYLGHRDPRTTLSIYTHIRDSDLPSPSTMSLPA